MPNTYAAESVGIEGGNPTCAEEDRRPRLSVVQRYEDISPRQETFQT
jgi:hypothetical protein